MNESNYNAFINVCIEFCKGDSSLSDVTDSLQILRGKLNGNNMQSVIADILWFIDSMLSDTFTENIKNNFIIIINMCEKMFELNTSFLKDRLSDEVLESLALINSKKNYLKRFSKTENRYFYKQKKFTLVHEANEGYSKLIVELVIFDNHPLIMSEKVKSIIGFFDLDATRVIDLILDVLELRLDKSTQFIDLLRLLGADKQEVCHLIARKLIGNPHESLYKLIVTLVHHDALDLLSIYDHLSPSDESVHEQYDRDMDNVKTKKFVNNFPLKLKDKPFASVDDVCDRKIDDRDYSQNQKIRFCFYFLQSGHWELGKHVMDILPPYFTLRFPPLCKLICRILHAMIEPLYRRCCLLPEILKSLRPNKFITLIGSFEPVTEFSDFNKLVFEMTNYLGPLLSTDHILFTKFIKITQSYLSERKTHDSDSLVVVDDTYQGFFNLLRNCLLPSLSMLSCDVSLAEEMWDAVKYLPYDLRYSLYVEWGDISYDDYPPLIDEKRSIQSQIRFLLKRLNKDNVKQIGRQFGKLCHCNPGIVFTEVLESVMMCSALSIPVVDTVKYLGNLSLDVLMFTVIETLARDRGNTEVTQPKPSNQSISSFVGLLCKRYQFDLVGLFQFMLNSVKDGRCSDLSVIKEVVHKITGIDVSEDLTDDQIETMSGGDILRQESGHFTQIRSVRKNSCRLKDVLIEHNLVIPFVILLSQERNLLIHRLKDEHIKTISRLFDQCHDSMLQMANFFSLHWTPQELINNCPPISDLFGEYNIDPDMAFCLNRSKFKYSVQDKYNALTNGSIDSMGNDELELFSTASQEAIEDYVKSITGHFSHEVWDDFNSAFYCTFWLLESRDLMMPEAAYRRQDIFLKALIKQTEQDISLGPLKKQKEVDRYNVLIEKLRDEAKRGDAHVQSVDHWLNSVKGRWFVKNKSGAAKAIVMTRFIELCVFPRVCFSMNDANFVAQLIYKLHRMKTPAFSTLICLDRIFNDITLMISTCSENEAKRYGRFLDLILTIIMRWHSSEEVFNEECVSHPGFVTVFRKNTDGNNKADQLTYENYRHVLHKWHYRVTKSIVSCLESENFVQIRNSLIILEKVIANYPKVQQFGQAIEKRIELLKEKEKDKRPDLHVLTQSYYGHMIAKKSLWLQDKDFHQKEDTKKSPVVRVAVANGEKPLIENSAPVIVNKSSSPLIGRRPSEEKDSSLEVKRRKVEGNTVDSKVKLVKQVSGGIKKH